MTKLMTNEQKAAITRIGLGSLLKANVVYMRASLLKFLIDRYDPRDFTFTIGQDQRFSLTQIDVDRIMGLRDEGEIIEADDEITVRSICHNICQHVSNEGFLITSIDDAILFQDTVDDDYIRRVVLYTLGTLLIPMFTTHVPLSYYSMVRNFAMIDKINWNELTLGFLRSNLRLHKDGSRPDQWPFGNLALLQVCRT